MDLRVFLAMADELEKLSFPSIKSLASTVSKKSPGRALLGKAVPKLPTVEATPMLAKPPPMPSAAQRAARSLKDPAFRQAAERAAGGELSAQQVATIAHRSPGATLSEVNRIGGINPKQTVGQGMEQSWNAMSPKAQAGGQAFVQNANKLTPPGTVAPPKKRGVFNYAGL